MKASNFAEGFSPGEIALLSLPARVGGPGFTFIHDKRDNPLESTKGDYFTWTRLRPRVSSVRGRKRLRRSAHEYQLAHKFRAGIGRKFDVLRIWR